MTDIATKVPATDEPSWIGPVILLMGGISIGFAPILLRYGVGDGSEDMLGPQAVAFWRFLLAIPMLLALNYAINRRLPHRPGKFAILAGIFFGIDIGLWHWGLTLTTVANATFLVGLGNLLAGLAAWIIMKDRPTPIWALAAAIALVGAALLSLGGPTDETAKTDLRGDALSFAAAVFVSIYIVCAKLARRTMNALNVLFWATVAETIVAAGMVGVSNIVPAMPAESLLPANASALLAPFLLAIVVQMMGQGLIIFGLGKTSAAIAGVMVVIQPVTAAGLAWVLFEEPLFAFQILGAGLILSGVFIAGRYGARVPST